MNDEVWMINCGWWVPDVCHRLYLDDVFYDLGSGTGRAVMAACLTLPLRACIGVEIMNTLHHTATSLIPHLHSLCDAGPADKHDVSHCPGNINHVSFINTSFFSQTQWVHHADIIFIASLCFTNDTMDKLSRMVAGCRRGTRIATFKDIDHERLRKYATIRLPMSWGGVTVLFYIVQWWMQTRSFIFLINKLKKEIKIK